MKLLMLMGSAIRLCVVLLSTALFYYYADCHYAERCDGMSVDVLISVYAETVTGDIFVHYKLLSRALKYWTQVCQLLHY